MQNTMYNKKKTWLYVMGWIFIFPLPLTIILKNKNINNALKYGIIIVAWLLYAGIIVSVFSKKGDNGSLDSGVSSDINMSEDLLADFYKEFSETGTVDNIEELVKKHGLFVDSRKTGNGKELFKVAETNEEARVTGNGDVYTGTYYVRIECTILGEKKVESAELVDNRNEKK